MLIINFIPISTKYWFVIQCFFVMLLIKLMNKYKYIKNRILGYNVSVPLIAQYALGFAHVCGDLSFCIAYVYRDWLGIKASSQEYMVDWGIGLSTTYFMVDSILIILIDFKVQYLYLIHHALAIFMGLVMHHKIISLDITVAYMFTIEFSNMAISAWDIVKRARKAQILQLEEPSILNTLQNILTPIFMFTYVPARTVMLTCSSIVLLYNINTNNIYLKTSIWFCTGFILYMSCKFAIKVYGIGYKSISQNFPGLLTFTSLTYVFKAYISLVWFTLVLPNSSRHESITLGLMLLFVDLVHIIISLGYSSSFTPDIFISALDYISVCFKIVINGIYIYMRAYFDNNMIYPDIWKYTMYANVCLLAFSIYTSRNANAAFEKRNPMPYLLHYLISAIVPLFLMPFGTAPYTAIISYFIGGLIWTLYPKSKYSVGWMHIFMTIADVALLGWGS